MSMSGEVLALTDLDHNLVQQVVPGRWEKMFSCIQCGTCTASCPAAHVMDISPRRMWRMVQMGLIEEVLRSRSIWLCSACYTCQVRCPRGIPLTETINRLKEAALHRGLACSAPSRALYRSFLGVLRRYGRIREMELMIRYVLATNPLAGVRLAPLGLKMLLRGKLPLQLPRLGAAGRLDRLLERVTQLEAPLGRTPPR